MFVITIGVSSIMLHVPIRAFASPLLKGTIGYEFQISGLKFKSLDETDPDDIRL